MNTTEERLKDALDAVGETLRPGDVPAPGFAERRAPRSFRRIVPVAAAAAIAVAVGGGVLAGGALDGTNAAKGTQAANGAPEPSAAPSPSRPPTPSASPTATPASGPGVVVYLCTRTLPGPACHGREATNRDRRVIGERLNGLPFVRAVQYESTEAAYERWKERFAESPEFDENTREGDVPASFRVRVDDRESVKSLKRALTGVSGIDRIVVEGAN
ncbi:hypothetical protein GCM10010182_04390 [Actinomadura cremea]|nr:hypothetical protein GCM10010182_04390 [Actinomadura cremea]